MNPRLHRRALAAREWIACSGVSTSVDANDQREALFVFCLLSCRLVSPPQAIKEWIPDDEPDLDWFNRPRNPSNPDPDGYDQSQTWQAPEIQLDDGRILVLESS